MARFGRVLTAMITPFTADGDLDLDGAQELAQWKAHTEAVASKKNNSKEVAKATEAT